MTFGMLVQIGLCWLALVLLACLFYAVLRDQTNKAYWRGHRAGYRFGRYMHTKPAEQRNLRVVK